MINCTLDLSVEKRWCILKCPRVGNFEVMSGDYNLRNKIQCSRLPDATIPEGKYYIVDRYNEAPANFRQRVARFGYESWDNLLDILYNNVHSLWLSLYRDDGNVDDHTDLGNGHKRGNFRLHPLNRDESGTSDGCVTLRSVDDFLKLLAALKDPKNVRERISGTKLEAYGTITVTGYSSDVVCHETKLDKSNYQTANTRKWVPHFIRDGGLEGWPLNTLGHKALEYAAFNDSGYLREYREQFLELDRTGSIEKFNPTLEAQRIIDKLNSR